MSRNGCLGNLEFHMTYTAYTLSIQHIMLVGVGFTLLIWLGLIANGMVIHVFSSKSMRSAGMNLLLRSLAISDILYLVSFWFNQVALRLPLWVQPDLSAHRILKSMMDIGMFITYPWMKSFYTASTWLLVIASLERYLAICFPFKQSYLHDKKIANFCIVVVFVCAILVNIPSFMQFYLTRANETNGGNGSVIKLGYRVELLHSISQYYVILRAVMHFAIPFTLLIYCNTKVALAIRQIQKFHQTGISNVARNEMKSTGTMFIAYGVMFIVCHAWPTGHYVLETFYKNWYTYCVTQANLILCDLEHLLLIVNASCPLIIYIAYGSKFRQMWLHLFCSRCKPEYTLIESANRKNTSEAAARSHCHNSMTMHEQPGNPTNVPKRSFVKQGERKRSAVVSLLPESQSARHINC